MKLWKAALSGGAFCALAVCVHPLPVRSAELFEPSRFLADVREPHPPTTGPSHPVMLRWNLSEAGEFSFRYRQQTQALVETSSTPPERSKVHVRSSHSDGTVLVQGRNGFADLILKDQRARIVMTPGAGEAPKTIEQVFPPMVLQKMREDGSIPVRREKDLALGLLFRMPARSLARGETVEVPVRIPFESSGSQFEVGGRVRMTLSDFVQIDGRVCARLDAEIDISRLDLPGEVPGAYSYTARGASVLFFDVGESRVVAGRTALRLKKAAETPVSSATVDGVPVADGPDWSRVAEDLDTFIEIEAFGG